VVPAGLAFAGVALAAPAAPASAGTGLSSSPALRSTTDATPPSRRPAAMTPVSARGSTQRSGLLAGIGGVLLLVLREGRGGRGRVRLGRRVQAVGGGGERRRRGGERVALEVRDELELGDGDDAVQVGQLGQERAHLVVAAEDRDLDRQLGVVALGLGRARL